MLVSDTVPRRSVTNSVAVDAEVNGLGDPVGRNTLAECSRDTTCAVSSFAAVSVNVASKVGLVLGVPEENDSLDSVEGGTGELGKGVDSGGSTLRVAFKNEASVGVGGKSVVDLGDDVRGGLGRVLVVTGGVDGVVLGATRDGGADLLVHGDESGGGTLRLTGTTGVDECVRGASGALGEGSGLRGTSGGEESDEGSLGEHV